MNFNWLNKKNNKKLIAFFNGWGMDDGAVKHLEPANFDVLTVCDYNTLSPLPDISEYAEIYVVAWSMGVMIATLYDINKTGATAINGTLFPISAEYGINPRIYKLMETNFDETSCKKFIRNMFDVIPDGFVFPSRSIGNQKAELTALRGYKGNEDYKYTRVIVCDNDKIIPSRAQINYWKTPEIISGGHCPFFNYTKWEELL